MSKTLAEWAGRQARRDKAAARPARAGLSAPERRALHLLRREAKAAGASLENRGRGGLSPSLVLHVMRRDGYACKLCEGREHALTLHHKGGVVEKRWVALRGPRNEPSSLLTVCGPCHDRVHAEYREAAAEQ